MLLAVPVATSFAPWRGKIIFCWLLGLYHTSWFPPLRTKIQPFFFNIFNSSDIFIMHLFVYILTRNITYFKCCGIYYQVTSTVDALPSRTSCGTIRTGQKIISPLVSYTFRSVICYIFHNCLDLKRTGTVTGQGSARFTSLQYAFWPGLESFFFCP